MSGKVQKVRNEKHGVRKVLVRNAIIPAKPSETVHCDKKRVQFANLIDDDEDEDENEENEPSVTDEKDFSAPEFNSILKLAEDIKKIQFRPLKDLRKAERGECSTNYTGMRFNMNFQPDEKLYQDLVTVEKPVTECEPKVKCTSKYKSTLKKDPEPNYEELLSHSLQPEYRFSKIVVPTVKRPGPQYDGRSVYRFLKQSGINF